MVNNRFDLRNAGCSIAVVSILILSIFVGLAPVASSKENYRVTPSASAARSTGGADT